MTSFGRESLVHERFSDHAVVRPEAIAVRCGDEMLSYGALERRANQLARELRQRGVEPEVLVGLMVDRSLDLIVGILGILKAGGAYVPLDPLYPAERLAFLQADARPALVVTQASHLGLVAGAEALCLDRDRALLDAQSPDPIPWRSAPEHAAYVIYTSGSTGSPKGVLVEHRQVARLFARTEPWYGFDERDVWSLFHSFAFDFSVWEIWGALAYGGRLVVVPAASTRDMHAFRRLLAREQVTVLNQTPSAFYQLSHADETAHGTLALRFIIFGGEALDLAALRPWYARHADDAPRLVNMYGITETTVHVTYRPLCAKDAQEAIGSLIGRPISDLTLHVLDARGQPVADGESGELYVGGAGLARGYLNRPELTATRFIASSASSGARLYRTGDVVCRRVDGELEYRGRADHQVKLRGFRIELGEIEAALAPIEGVRENAVVVREDAPGQRRLVAYFVGDADEATLVARLSTVLPAHMVPTVFVRLASMPLTHHGKLDRGALPAPESGTYVAPRDDLEARLAVIWQETLKVERVGVHDDYSFLGGNSLTTMQVVARIRTALSADVTASVLHEAPTIAALARRLTVRSHEEPPAPAVARDPSGWLPVSFAQEHYVRASHHTPLLTAWRIEGPLDLRALEAALSEVVRRHAALRAVFAVVDGEARQRFADAAPVSIAVEDLSALSPDAQLDALRRRLLDELGHAFDRAEGPLFRVALLRYAPLDHGLVLAVDHVSFDLLSIGVFDRELRAAYHAFASAQPSPLPDLPFDIADYALWQRSNATADRLAQHVAFWRGRLADAPSIVALPMDRPRGNGPAQTKSLRAPLESALVRDALLGAASQGGAFVTLWAALLVVLWEASGQDDLVVGTVYANRDRVEVLDLVGCFINFLALRGSVRADDTFESLRSRLRHELLQAIDHAELPHARVVESLGVAPRPGRHPLCNVILQLEQADEPNAAATDPKIFLAPLPELPLPPDRVDLRIVTTLVGDRGTIELHYDALLFDEQTIERLLFRYLEVLASFAHTPRSHVGARRLVQGVLDG